MSDLASPMAKLRAWAVRRRGGVVVGHWSCWPLLAMHQLLRVSGLAAIAPPRAEAWARSTPVLIPKLGNRTLWTVMDRSMCALLAPILFCEGRQPLEIIGYVALALAKAAEGPSPLGCLA